MFQNNACFGLEPENFRVMPLSKKAWLGKFLTNKRREFGYTEEMQRARHIHFQVRYCDGA